MKLCLRNRNRRAAIRRRYACILAVICTVVWWCASAPPVRAQQTSEFILRASPARIEAIAARHGLTIVRQLPGQNVFLVRRDVFITTSTKTLTSDAASVETDINNDPDVVNFEYNAVVMTPEVASALNLNGSAVSILDSASDISFVNYFNAKALSGYVNQP